MPPLWVQLWSFQSSRFYCLTCGDLKKKKTEGRRDKKGEKEGVEQERRKERRKVLKERKNDKKILIKNYLKKPNKQIKKKTKPADQASFAGLFGCSQLRQPSPALLHQD